MAVNSFNAQNPPVTTKGDVFTFSTIPTRLAVGANNTVLTADSTTATGLKWATPASASQSFSLLNAGGTALTGATSVSITGITNQNTILVYVTGGSSVNASSNLYVSFNSDAGSSATYYSWAVGSGANTSDINDPGSYFRLGQMGNAATNTMSGSLVIFAANTTGYKPVYYSGSGMDGTNRTTFAGQGFYAKSSTVTSVQIVSSSGNWDAGTVYVYGSQI